MAKKNGKITIHNGFPTDDKGRPYDDGYSFDEFDRDEEDELEDSQSENDAKFNAYVAQRKQLAEEYNNLSEERARKVSDEDLCRMYDAAMEERDLEG